MNIFQVLLENFRLGPITLSFPQQLPTVHGFRGLVQNDPERCVGCGACAYVCSSSAVTITEQADGYKWFYDPGQCTFCGRCLDYCPFQALSMLDSPPAAYEQHGALVVIHSQGYPPCPRCGKPAHPANHRVLERAFPEVPAEVLAWSRLCLHCRQETVQPAFLIESAKLRG